MEKEATKKEASIIGIIIVVFHDIILVIIIISLIVLIDGGAEILIAKNKNHQSDILGVISVIPFKIIILRE